MRLAWAVKEGVGLAHSLRPIPLKYFRAITDTLEEAREMAFKVNTARKEESIWRKGWSR